MNVEDRNEIVEVNRPAYDSKRGTYLYPVVPCNSDSITITQLWPIMMKINIKSGQSSFILSTYTSNALP